MNFKLKEGYRLSSDTSDECTIYSNLRKKNKTLTEYLETLDFKDIIINKINMLTAVTNKNSDYSNLFCDKEKEIITDIFGIKEMHRENKNKSRQTLISIYGQEDKSVDNSIRTLKKIRER